MGQLLEATAAKRPRVSTSKEKQMAEPQEEGESSGEVCEERTTLLRTVSDLARECKISDEQKGMLKDQIRDASIPVEALSAAIENIVQGGALESDECQSPLSRGAKGEEDGGSCEVWIVRHGERFDEVPGNNWFDICGDLWFDPPLTDEGKKQAAAASEIMMTMNDSNGIPISFDTIYSSPLQRCVSTAEPFSARLGAPVRMCAGLGDCCAALRGEHMELNAAEERFTTQQMMKGNIVPMRSKEELQRLCPKATFTELDPVIDKYQTCVERLAVGKKRILIVTHREGIRDFIKMLKLPRTNTPYCCTALFKYTHGAAGVELEKMGKPTWEFCGIKDCGNVVAPRAAMPAPPSISADMLSGVKLKKAE